MSSVNDSIVEVKVQINTNTGTDDLGGATLVLKFDTTKYVFPSSPAANTDYIFHNFNGGNYGPASVTNPISNEIWINIELEINNQGTVVAGSTSWTDVVTLKMKLKQNQQFSWINYSTSSPFWAVFDGNNTTLWNTGIFSPISSIENQFENVKGYSLSQNYPNPFNPSTKIKFSTENEHVVKLTVYNMLGEMIEVLVDNEIAAGNHEITFYSEGLPSGTYIYRFEIDKRFIDSKKMILLK
jgi:hypothetical protein